MYNIMIAKSKRDNYETLYQFLTSTTDGVTEPLEIETKTALDVRIGKMLNDGNYAKSDFIVVEVIDYTIDAIDYSDEDDESEDTEDTTDTTDTEDSAETSEDTESEESEENTDNGTSDNESDDSESDDTESTEG